MSERFELHVAAADLLEVLGPTNAATIAGVSIEGASGTVFLIEERKDQFLALDAAGSGIFVADVSEYSVGDQIMVVLDTRANHLTTVASLDPTVTPQKITLAAGLASAARAGRQVMGYIGPALTLTEFGTIKAPYDKSGEWGYRVTKTYDHDGLLVGQLIRVLYTLTGSAGEEFTQNDPHIVVE